MSMIGPSDELNCFNTVPCTFCAYFRQFFKYLDLSGPTKYRKCIIPLRMDGFVLACPECGNQPKTSHLGAALYEVEKIPAEEVAEFVEERRTALLGFIDSKDIGLPKAESSWLCRYCAHIRQCVEGQAFISKTSK